MEKNYTEKQVWDVVASDKYGAKQTFSVIAENKSDVESMKPMFEKQFKGWTISFEFVRWVRIFKFEQGGNLKGNNYSIGGL